MTNLFVNYFSEAARPHTMVLIEEVPDGGYGRADEVFVVPEAYRGRGFGAQLLERAEAYAIGRKCAGIWLSTFSFQARGFYEKQGYEVFGSLPDHPRGGARFFLRKLLTAGSS